MPKAAASATGMVKATMVVVIFGNEILMMESDFCKIPKESSLQTREVAARPAAQTGISGTISSSVLIGSAGPCGVGAPRMTPPLLMNGSSAEPGAARRRFVDGRYDVDLSPLQNEK
jgi:hypothetical protein